MPTVANIASTFANTGPPNARRPSSSRSIIGWVRRFWRRTKTYPSASPTTTARAGTEANPCRAHSLMP